MEQVVSLNINKLVIQIDAALVVDVIVKNISDNILLKLLLFECRTLLDKILYNAIIHIFTKVNHYADLLAKKGLRG